jgi:hypothetical protein
MRSIILAAWVLNTFGFWGNPTAAVYPDSTIGAVRNITAGKLKCGGRLNDIGHLQTWCYKGAVIVWNSVQDFSNGGVANAYYYDNKPNETDAYVAWLVAYVEGNPKTVGYQISYAPDPAQPPVSISGQF